MKKSQRLLSLLLSLLLALVMLVSVMSGLSATAFAENDGAAVQAEAEGETPDEVFAGKVLKFWNDCDKIKLPHKFIFSCCKRAFFTFGKNAGSAFVRFWRGIEFVWQQMGLCVFRCVVPFGAAHFFIFQKEG